MSLFSIKKNNKAKRIASIQIEKERRIQRIFENNLEEILDIIFVKTEHTIPQGRIDTLGIDYKGSPVVIEYKKKKDDNVINQGLSYLYWVREHKADFEKLVQKVKVGKTIDWKAVRLVCVAERYNKHDFYAAACCDIDIQLLKFIMYDNDILLIESEKPPETPVSISKRSAKKEKAVNVSKKKTTLTIESHLSGVGVKARELFEILNEKIITLDASIIVEPKKTYIAYKLARNFVDVVVQKGDIKIYLNVKSGKLKDPQKSARDLTKPKKGHSGNGDYEVKLKKEEDIDKVFELIEQSYNYNK